MRHEPIKATDIIVALRCILGLPPLDRPPSDDVPAHLPVTLVVHALHARWWLAWCVAGLELFSRRERPTMAAAILAARRTLATMDDEVGNLGAAARSLSTGSRNLRRVLEEAGAWPWQDPIYRDPPVKRISWCACTADDGEYAA